MIASVHPGALPGVVRFAEELSRDPSARSYPAYSGSDEFRREFARRMEDGFLWVWEENGELCGVCAGFSVEEDRYFQTTVILSREERVLSGFVNEIDRLYPEYERFIGFDGKNVRLARVLEQAGYQVADDMQDVRIAPGQGAPRPGVRLLPAPTADFREYHDRIFPDIYWDAPHMAEKWELFRVYVTEQDGRITGECFLKPGDDLFEICGAEAKGPEALLSHAVWDAGKTAPGMFLIETGDDKMLRAAEKVGFRRENHYICCEKKPMQA